MDTDTELRLLEEQFPKSSQLWNTDTDPALDRRILAIADGVAPYFAQQHMRKEQARQSEDRDRGSPPPEYRPTMRHLPKHLKLGTKSRVESSIPYLQKFDRMDTPPVEQINIPPAKRTATPAGADSMLALLEGADPQTWLDGIAAIVRRGDIELAIYLLRQYRIVFRDK